MDCESTSDAFAKSRETIPLYEQSLCSEADIPELDLSLSSNTNEEIQNSVENSWGRPGGSMMDSSPILSIPPDILSEERLDACALVDILRARFAAQRDKIAAVVECDPELHNRISDYVPESALSYECAGRIRACSPVRPHPDVDFTIQDSCGLKTEYPVYTCHHIDGTDSIILSQSAIERLEIIITSRDDKLHTSKLEIVDLRKALREKEQENYAAVQATNDARKAENKAMSTLNVVSQEKHNALAEIRLLQQALQFAQRGYSTAQEKVKTLHKTLEAVLRDRDTLQERLEAVHEVLAATKVEQMNLRKDHEFAKTQSKGYLKAMQQSIDGHEAARMQLKEHYGREGQIAATRIMELERRNVDLEQRLETKLHVLGRNIRVNEHLEISYAGSLGTMVDEEYEKKQKSGWRLGLWRVSTPKRFDDLESGRLVQAEPPSTHGTDAPAQQTEQRSWAVKSLRLPGTWGGRTRDGILPSWEP